MANFTRIILLSTLCFGLVATAYAEGSPPSDDSFLPTWKLLNREQKLQFVAGYLHGFTDAKRVMDVAIEYVRENPNDALNGLEKIRSLYDLGGLRPDSVARELDTFYADAKSKDASLSQAMSTVKSRMGR